MSARKILYLEAQSGISGDMAVAALLDLGADPEKLKQALASLGLDGYRLEISQVSKCGILARDFNVILEENEDLAEHSHKHAHHESVCGHAHGHDRLHGPEHPPARSSRNFKDIVRIIRGSAISAKAKALAEKTFRILAEAEAEAHGLSPEEVHFHEAGALDSIVDIVAAAICLDDLEVEETVISRLTEGRGHVLCRHGLLPVPAPAVLNIARTHGLILHLAEEEEEMVTPTGAAIAAALKTQDHPPPGFIVRAVGLGAGKKDFRRANILRAMLLEEHDKDVYFQPDRRQNA
ncbi:MAG: LarC family nickel insertion protein [Desulfovibrionaceae bacterium]|nr:LarC family nickel insertion protein [Desulfovibrionaceae bacterium]